MSDVGKFGGEMRRRAKELGQQREPYSMDAYLACRDEILRNDSIAAARTAPHRGNPAPRQSH